MAVKSVEAFGLVIATSAETFMQNPLSTPLIPNWNRVTSAIPAILDMICSREKNASLLPGR